MRRCKIPTGCKLPNRPCCTDCKDKACQARCWNSPERCGCWEENGQRSKSGRKPKIDRQAVLRLRKQGLSQREIAWQLGCCKSTVCVALMELGVMRNG